MEMTTNYMETVINGLTNKNSLESVTSHNDHKSGWTFIAVVQTGT